MTIHYNWGIVGTSSIAYEVSYAIKYLKGNKIVAVVSRNSKNSKKFASKMGLSRSYEDFNELLDDREINIIYIAIPNHLHFDFIKKCLLKGKHVLCEKPICLKSQEARIVQKLSKEHRLFCMEANWVMFNPALQKLISYVKAGKIGEIKNITGSFGHVLEKQPIAGLGQGVLFDLGVYLISICIKLLGKPDKVVGSEAYDHEQMTLSLIYQKNITVSLTCSHVADLKNEFVVIGSKGIMTINDPFYRSGVITFQQLYRDEEKSSSDEKHETEVRNYYSYPLFLKYAPFLKRIYERFTRGNLMTPFIGSSYHYQIEEVNKCLKLGMFESSIHPMENSVAALEVIESIMKNK